MPPLALTHLLRWRSFPAMWIIRVVSGTLKRSNGPAFDDRLLFAIFIAVFSMSIAPHELFAQSLIVDAAMIKKAREIHERVITLDTHIDFAPANLVGERNYTQRLETQFELPKIIDGVPEWMFF